MFQCHHNHEDNGANAPKGHMFCPPRNIMPIFLIVLIIFFSVWSIESIVNSKSRLKEVENLKAERTLSVSAEGKVIAVPDIAKINFSVVTEAKTAKEAQSKNTEKMNKVLNYLKELDIDKKDIETTSYYLYPKYEYPNGKSILVGYTLTNSIAVKIRNFEIIGDVLLKSVDLGINQVGDVQFLIDNPDDFKDQAGSLAIENAKAKAGSLAQKAGVRLGKIITFSESEAGSIPPIYYAKAEGLGMGGGPQIEQGTQEVRIIANIVFEIE